MWKSADGEQGEADDAKGAPSGAADNAEEGSAKGGRSLLGKKLIVLLVAGLVLAGGGIGAVKFLGGGGGEEKPEAKRVVAPLTWEFGDIVVNILGTRDTRVLRVVLHVEVDGKAALDELRLRELVFRDEIIEILRSKSLDDLKYPGENAIKRQIRDRLNQIMIKGSVVEVYFKEFLIH
jgi:flagellar basal body-associated protein FliL